MDIKHAVVGNIVKINYNSEFSNAGISNPLCNGVISNIDKVLINDGHFGINVKWDNGESNFYRLVDLIFVETPKAEQKIWYYVGTCPLENCFSSLKEAMEKLDELNKPSINWDQCGESKYKQVQYFGKDFFINQSHQYVFTSYSGSVRSSDTKPTWDNENKLWYEDALSNSDILCTSVCVNHPEKTLKYFE